MNPSIFSKQSFFALAALAWSALLPATAKAATVSPSADGDVFIGFRASAGDGSSVSYLIKLGSYTTFQNAAQGSAFDVTGLGSTGADLEATFGAGWATRSDLFWGVFATRLSGVNATVYGSKPRTTTGVIATAWNPINSSARTNTRSNINSVTTGVGGYDGSDVTVNSSVATVQANAATASSYNFQVSGTSDFGTLSGWTNPGIEASFANGTAGAVLDFFRLSGSGTTNTVAHIGSFSINSSGTIRFTAVPLASNVDSDGDGFTDSQEALAGTNPINASSFFRAAVTVTANGPRIQSPTAANQTYTVEYSETLTGTWLTVATIPSGAGASPIDFTDTDAGRRAKAKGFYRIRVSS